MGLTPRKIFMAFTTFLFIVLAMIVTAQSASAVEVFNPASFTHNDTLDTYTNRPKLTSDQGEYVNMNAHSPTTSYRYGGYVTAGDTHRYQNLRLIQARALPGNYLSVYADVGVNFRVIDYFGVTVLDTGDPASNNPNEILFNNTTNYTGGRLHLYQLREYAQGTNYASYFYIEFYTTSETALHYNVWYGCPLFAQSRTLMYVPTRTISKPTTTSTAVSTTTTRNAVPDNSWIKSIRYVATSQSGSSNLSVRYDSVRNPSTTSYQRILPGNTQTFTVNNTYAYNAQGTYLHRFESCMWASGTSTGSTYSNSATCYVEYYYIFGRGDTPYYQ